MRARPLLLLLLLTALTAFPARAVTLPEVPDSLRILTRQEVKNYWVNQLPEPVEPSSLARGYQDLMVTYRHEVGERQQLILAIRVGKYEQRAEIVRLRHNILAYHRKGDDDKVFEFGEELAKLEAAEAQQAAQSAQADRLERLIAATERLAAAIEENGGALPADADEIIPFERDRDDRRDVATYLYEEIAICNRPFITRYHHRYGSHVVPARPHHVGRPITQPRPSVFPQQPQVSQPQVRPVR
jgi:hypothetical protein